VQLSFAQRYEDTLLSCAFVEQASGFYVDVGAGHPIYDNVSFAFYMRGWRGLTVEPNAWLSELSAVIRPRDARAQALVGEQVGEATFYLVEGFHGLSTTVERNARAALRAFGKASRAITMPSTTLSVLCEDCAPATIDFLKIDVEGAERATLLGNDWERFRPKVVVVEALAPVTLAPAWDDWEPLLTGSGYGFVRFDGLNRYYVANEQPSFAERLAVAPSTFQGVAKFSDFGPALDDPSHPDHALALLFEGFDMIRLPTMSFDEMAERLLCDLDPSRPIRSSDVANASSRLFGRSSPPDWVESLGLAPTATVADLYRAVATSEAFRVACGRISASSAW
jgi:FkbM family methyltransferase